MNEENKENFGGEKPHEEKAAEINKNEENFVSESYKKYIEPETPVEYNSESSREIKPAPEKPKKRKKTGLIIVVVALLLVVGVAVTIILSKDKPWVRKIVDDWFPFITTQSSDEIEKSYVPDTVKVTLIEGWTTLQIAEELEANGVCSKDEFLSLCNEPYEGIEISNPEERIFLLEGYIFPDTYEFYKNSDPKAVLKKFIDNYNSKITPEMEQRAAELGMTMDEIITLASIIQKECDADKTECANVSSVFHNRLASSSFPKLESDVTTFYIKYNLADFLGYATDDEGDPLPLAEQSEEIQNYINLYSTYYCKGIPAGPICNPSLKAINAALYPSDTNYYYFLTDPTGVDFYYAETISQHQQNGKDAGLF